MNPIDVIWWSVAILIASGCAIGIMVMVLFGVEIVRRFLRNDPLPLGIQRRPPG
jgi:hypothetical protein